MIMIDQRTKQELKNIEVLKDPLLYIYILLNSAGKVKVGKTTNIAQRVQSLGGSNGAGDKIIRCYCSEPTYIFNIEFIMHEKMKKYRIPNTEWFYYDEGPDGELLYSSAVGLLERLTSSKEYEKCNLIRKKVYEEKEKKHD